MGNNYKLKEKFGDWNKKTDLYFEMYYEIREPKLYFYYQNAQVNGHSSEIVKDEISKPFRDSGLLVSIDFTRDSAGNIVPGNREYEAELDIGIRENYGDTLVTVKTIDKGAFTGLYWHQSSDNPPSIEAIMTEHDRTDHYAELTYSTDGNRWTKKIPAEPCRFIRFKAKEKGRPMEEHKFSYNVRMPDVPDYFEIDPEIQNPKT